MKAVAVVLEHAPELVVVAVGIVLVCAPLLMRRRSAMEPEWALSARRIRVIGTLLIVLAIAWLAYTACRAYLQRSGEVMYRAHAGTRGADGWVAAMSTKGAFAVRLPAEFNDFSLMDRDSVGRFITTHALVASPESNILFVAQLIIVAGSAIEGENALCQFEADRMAAATVGKFHSFSHNGFPGLDSVDTIMTPAGSAMLFMRRIRAPEGLYMLSVTCPTNSVELVRKPAAYFFESLRAKQQ